MSCTTMAIIRRGTVWRVIRADGVKKEMMMKMLSNLLSTCFLRLTSRVCFRIFRTDHEFTIVWYRISFIQYRVQQQAHWYCDASLGVRHSPPRRSGPSLASRSAKTHPVVFTSSRAIPFSRPTLTLHAPTITPFALPSRRMTIIRALWLHATPGSRCLKSRRYEPSWDQGLFAAFGPLGNC